jgi:hypothetical protein
MKVSVSDCCLTRRAFLIYVDLDPTPGPFHTSRSAWEALTRILRDSIGDYNPVVALASDEIPVNEETGRKRICFVLFVDLDPIPGSMHSQESAQNIVRFSLTNLIPHYKPMVSLAPDHLQPESVIG